MKDAPFKSEFAILDVKKGRQDLRKRVNHGETVRVQRDDGVSQEFSAVVTSVKLFKQPVRPTKKRARR